MKGRFRTPIWVIPALVVLMALGVFAMVALLDTTLAQQIPPHVFIGTVTINGVLAPVGTAITAFIDGVVQGSTEVGSGGGYTLVVNQGSSTDITFKIGNLDANETATWEQGGATTLDLTTPGITVNTTVDDNIVNGNCTLREAIIAANTDAPVDGCPAGSGTDAITLPSTGSATYTLSVTGSGEDAAFIGDLDITDDLTIIGGGSATTTIIDGGALDRVFHILIGSTVDISGVTIRNGSSVVGAGILNSGTLTLTNTTVVSNSGGKGGGIANTHVGSPPPDARPATLTLTNSTGLASVAASSTKSRLS